jgi:hypothetical protein
MISSSEQRPGTYSHLLGGERKMKNLPPLTDAILFALSRVVDDTQTGTREPSHSDIEFCIVRSKLGVADPKSQGQTVGKAKRVRAVLNWAIENDFSAGREFVEQLIGLVRGCGGFRPGSPNYVGEDAISTLRGALSTEGFVLTSDGELYPTVLESLSGVEISEALLAYVRRAKKGSSDALLARPRKDLLEATAAHVLQETWGTYSSATNFPILLGQAFVALGLKTPAERAVNVSPYSTVCNGRLMKLLVPLTIFETNKGPGTADRGCRQ